MKRCYVDVTWKLDKCLIFVFALVEIHFCLPPITHSGKQSIFYVNDNLGNLSYHSRTKAPGRN